MSQQQSVEHTGVAVIGAGQAGLSVSRHLGALGVEHLVFERDLIGQSWRSSRWDSFTLVTPDWMTRLAGYRPGPGAAARFLPRDEFVAVLERFARGLPVREQTPVSSVTPVVGGYQLVAAGRPVRARSVVVAGGGLRRPKIPPLSRELPPDLHQIHAGSYRNPAALPPGAVLVVGSGQSGAQIAEELAVAGHDVFLATSRVPRVPRRYRGRDFHEWGVELGLYDQRADQPADRSRKHEPHPMLSGTRGGHTLALQELGRDGVRLLGRLVGATDGRLRFASDLAENMRYADQHADGTRRLIDEYIAATGTIAELPDPDTAECPWTGADNAPLVLDLHAERISTVIWATGFGPDTDWLDLPVLTCDGSPIHTRGITTIPGLYVVGYPWLSNRGSGILYGVDADAARVAQHAAAFLAATGRLRPVDR